MEPAARTPEDLRRRREERRRAVRRRRLSALACVAVVLAAAGALLTRGGDATASRDAPAATAAPAPRSSARAPQARAAGPLGSGRAVTLAFGGDVHFESPIRELLAASPGSVLAPVAPVLRSADLAMVNLETAVSDGSARLVAASKQYVFRAPSSAFAALAAGGVDVASMANNHGLDYGEGGLRDSLAAARKARFPVVGIGLDDARAYRPYRVTVKGQRIAIIGATQVLDDHLIGAWTAGPGKPGLASAKDEARLLRAVREARRTSDTVVVHLHWGEELAHCPLPRQRTLARRLRAAGADVIVGGHAHVLNGAGRLGGALVAYGLGNFVFYASKPETVRTGVLKVTVTGRRVDGYEWVPARIAGGIPRPLAGAERTQAVRSWNALRGCTGLRP